MVINDFHILGVPALPNKANPILLVYPYAVLAFAVTFQCLQSVGSRQSQVLQ